MKAYEQKYINGEEVFDLISAFQYQMSQPELSANALQSEKYGQICLDLVENIIHSKNFYRYPQIVKDEMRSFALYKLTRAAYTFKCDYRKDDKHFAFSYLTRAVYLSFLTILSKYYKDIELKRQYIVDSLDKQHVDLNIQEKIILMIAPYGTTGELSTNPFNCAYKKKL